MTYGRRTVAAFATVLTALLTTVIGLAFHWPLPLWFFATSALGSLALLLVRATGSRPDPLAREFTPEPDLPIPPPEIRAHDVRDVALPSAWPDYDFRFSATVRWHPLAAPPHAPSVNPAGLAVQAVLERAAELTEDLEPHRFALAQYRLSGELGTMRPDPAGRLDVMAENVTLTLTDQDSARLDDLSTVRKEKDVWEHKRRHEQNLREYLSDDVLKTPGSAVVWWLAQNENEPKRAVDDIGMLAQLSSVAHDTDVPDRLKHLIPYPEPPTDPGEPPEPSAPGPFDPDPFDPDPSNGSGPTGAPPFAMPMNDGAASAEPPEEDAADLFRRCVAHLKLDPDGPEAATLAQSLVHVAQRCGADAEAARYLLSRMGIHVPGGDTGPQPAEAGSTEAEDGARHRTAPSEAPNGSHPGNDDVPGPFVAPEPPPMPTRPPTVPPPGTPPAWNGAADGHGTA